MRCRASARPTGPMNRGRPAARPSLRRPEPVRVWSCRAMRPGVGNWLRSTPRTSPAVSTRSCCPEGRRLDWRRQMGRCRSLRNAASGWVSGTTGFPSSRPQSCSTSPLRRPAPMRSRADWRWKQPWMARVRSRRGGSARAQGRGSGSRVPDSWRPPPCARATPEPRPSSPRRRHGHGQASRLPIQGRVGGGGQGRRGGRQGGQNSR